MEDEASKSMHKVCERIDGVNVYVSDEVFTTVVGMAALETEGLDSLADYSSLEALTRPGPKAFPRSIRLEFTEDGAVSVSLCMNIAFGYNIPDVAHKIQEKIMNEIFNMIGCHVAFVNIRVADVITK